MLSFDRRDLAHGLVSLFLALLVSSGHPAFADDPPVSNPQAEPITLEGTANPTMYTGPSFAVILDIATGIRTRVSVSNDDATLPVLDEGPANGVRIDLPISPADSRFARIEFNNGSSYCTASYIGKRFFLTAGHCVFDGGSFRANAIAFPGYENGPGNIGGFRAVRFTAFSGWTDGQDFAHDGAIVEVDRDLPAAVVPLNIVSKDVTCQAPMQMLFQRNYYSGNSASQFQYRAIHQGCKYNQISYFLGTNPGSSGSAAIEADTTRIYGVYSNFIGDFGFDARLTRGKSCYINGVLLGGSC